MARRLIDYFVICSLKQDSLQIETRLEPNSVRVTPLHRAYCGQVICHYPTCRSWNPFDESAVKIQCMPEGVKLSKSSHHHKFHSLIITRENGSRQYGSVLTYYEPISNPIILDTLESYQNEYQSKHGMGLSPDQYQYFNRSTDTLYVTKCLCLITSQPIFQPCRHYLEQLHAISVGNFRGSLPLESYLYNLLYETPLPGHGKTLHLHGPMQLIVWRFPGKDELPLCDYSFKKLFELISLKNILQLLTCVLLEQQILLKANDFQNLMLCAECITTLLFPYSWPHVFVPILPSSQHGFLDAPVPFIMGLRMDTGSTIDDLDILNKASLSSFDIDHDVLETPEDLPSLPDYDKLYTRLADVIVQYEVNSPDSILPSHTNREDKKHSIIDALRLVKSMSESPKLVKPGNPLNDSTANTTTNTLVKELQNIMNRNNCEDISSPSRVSPTTGLMESMEEEEEEEGEGRECKRVSIDDTEFEFSYAIRTIFCNYFVEHFVNYEHFVIMPDQSYQQWIRNREQFENFDKTAFLSDQPIASRAFYSAFLETAMFTLFIDQKLIATWDPSSTSDCILLFDKYIENHRHSKGIMTTPSAGTTPSESHDSDPSDWFDISPKPHLLNNRQETENDGSKLWEEGVFPSLDSSLLIQCDKSNSCSVDESSSVMDQPSKPSIINKSSSSSHTTGGGSVGTAYHLKFVMQLWRESRLRVKHMLCSSSEAQNNNIEENTHIANLCDLLERIWGHGLRKRESKSALWAHLMAFGETLCHKENEQLPSSSFSSSYSYSPSKMSRPLTPDPTHYSSTRRASDGRQISKTALLSHVSLDETGSSYSPSPKRTSTPSFFRRRFQSPELKTQVEAILQPPPSSFLDDLKIINSMREIKTDIGHARAWVRLCLEKKSLSRHLSCLLSDTNLSKQRYRHYAFLLTEDEREQFLLHLLSLSAGNFNCFSNAFTDTSMSYRVLVVSEGKYLGFSSTCLYVNVSGEGGVTGPIPIPKGTYQVEFNCRNLGTLTCVRLSHDNVGIVRSLLVEMVLVYCITTGQTYRFHCGRYFARTEDDGSIDRFIIGEKVSRVLKGSVYISASLAVDDVLPSTGAMKWSRSSPKKDTGDNLMLSDIKSSLMSCVSKVIAVCERSSKDTLRTKLLPLLYGPNGFVKTMENVFHLGFKNTRKFQKPLYVWDLIERVSMTTLTTQEGSDDDDHTSSPPITTLIEEPREEAWRTFLAVVSQIDTLSSIGKDERTMLFLLIGLRDHCLFDWIQVLANSTVTRSMYELVSFMRDPELLTFLLNCIKLTHSLTLTLEPLLIQGL